jgi:acetyltransferase-like isoleucine patch superfamily enzyme
MYRRVKSADSAGRYWLLLELRAKLFSRWLAPSFARFGEGAQIWPPSIVWGAGAISVESGAWIGPGTSLNAEGEGQIHIGYGTQIVGDNSISAHSRIEIGRRVLLARGATIVDHQHRSGDRNLPIADQGVDRIAPVTVGDGAWIGTNAIVMPGVTVGANAVVGASAVLTSDAEPGAVMVGAPARPLSGAAA